MQGAAILSPKTREILNGVADDVLRADVESSVVAAINALTALARIHLPQDHFEDSDATRATVEKHVDLAPYVLAAIAEINKLLETVGQRFAAPVQSEAVSDDFDLEFDLVDGPTGDGKRLAGPANGATAKKSDQERVAETLHALGGMVKSRVGIFGQRIRHAVAQSDSWPILAELDDNLHGLRKAVQGLLFGTLGVFNDSVGREEILPEYRSAVSEAVELRTAIAELTHHINRFNSVLANATPEQLVPLVVAVSDRLARFATRPEYRALRAEDKKAVIDFRRELHRLRYNKTGVPALPLRQAVEGFSKFLEAMHAINHREVLVLHDSRRLNEAIARLASAQNEVVENPTRAHALLQETVMQLVSVVGRSPELDESLRRFDSSSSQDAATLEGDLGRFRSLCEGVLSTVG